MKKLLTISLILFIFIMFSGCTSYVMSASSIEENASFNHYKFGALKGTYTFRKSISQDSTIRIVTYTEIEDEVLYIRIKKGDEVVKELEVIKSTNDTYYIDLVKGNYTFELDSAKVFKGELLFDWENKK